MSQHEKQPDERARMRCPSCGHGWMEHHRGPVTYRDERLEAEWEECPQCDETSWSPQEVRRLERMTRKD
jgi:uncharacterized protein with PIN domain